MAYNLLLSFTGESNASGETLNSEALLSEIAPYSDVQIWDNVNNNGFLDLKIADPDCNNQGIGLYHGWELQLANQVKDGKFPNASVFICKCGQGGTIASQWQSASALYVTMKSRVDGALAKIATLNANPIIHFIFVSIGINDATQGTAAATFKTNFGNFLSNMNTRYTPVKIIGTFIPTTTVNRLSINSQIIELGNELAYFDTVPANGATIRADGAHWDYLGMKIMANRLLNNINSNPIIS